MGCIMVISPFFLVCNFLSAWMLVAAAKVELVVGHILRHICLFWITSKRGLPRASSIGGAKEGANAIGGNIGGAGEFLHFSLYKD
jgi:hypothetical protein